MDEPNYDEVKVILRSILTSFPGTLNISQVLEDYEKLEGHPLPYKQLGFNTVYELLKSMNDIIKMPRYPTMDSFIKIILDQKSEHIRELVVNQKTKRPHQNVFKKGSRFVDSRVSFGSRSYNTSPYNYNARGYDHVRKLSSPKPTGIVTDSLQTFIEYLCNSSESKSISIHKLKNCLVTHPDYGKLGTTNLEVAIKMLKYFIYIDRGGVHLKESSHEIFSPKNCESRNISKSNINVVDEHEELENYNTPYDCGIFEEFAFSSEDSNKPNFNNLEIKNHSTIINQEKEADSLKTHSILKDKPSNNFTKPNIESKVNDENKNLSSNFMNKSENDYKSAIVSIIATSQTLMTVKAVMDSFKIKYGYSFPLEQLSCRTPMDFFRLHPALFKLDNQYSTTSLVTLHESALSNGSFYYRKSFIKASILYNQSYLDTWNLKFIPSVPNSNNISSISESSSYQKPAENIKNTLCTQSIDMHSKIYDSEMIMESMKNKMRNLLLKYEKGILCNEFMDVYAKEYNSQFTFYEYGFKSMKDMAYKLPSVFYVKVTEDECILFHAGRQNELDNENDLNDPSQYYKNIPKTILHNLSLFLKNHCDGIPFHDLKTLYCSQFGKCYEPLKYGYSSERHMFESLNKMVEIQNDMVFTKDAFAYAYFLKEENSINNYSDDCVLGDSFLINYSGKDICNGQFAYPEFPYSNKKVIQVVAAEIYNPSSFYIHSASQVETLEIFMQNLQKFYNQFENQYKVQSNLIIPGLVCTSCFENSGQWHRAIILRIVNENFVSVLYVDYGSIETVEKSSIRLLKSEFGNFPIQSLHCSLFDIDQMHNYNREINESFARLIEGRILEAHLRRFVSKGDDKIMVVTLNLKKNNKVFNINKQCLKEIQIQTDKISEESIRRTITVLLQDEGEPQD